MTDNEIKKENEGIELQSEELENVDGGVVPFLSGPRKKDKPDKKGDGPVGGAGCKW